MAVDIKFDANQQYQRDAIDSVVELFAGQEGTDQAPTSWDVADQDSFEEFREVVFGNTLALSAGPVDEPAARPGPPGPDRGRRRGPRDRRGTAHRDGR